MSYNANKRLPSYPSLDLDNPAINPMWRRAAESWNRRVAAFLRHVFGGTACAMQSSTSYKGSPQPFNINYLYICGQEPVAHPTAGTCSSTLGGMT